MPLKNKKRRKNKNKADKYSYKGPKQNLNEDAQEPDSAQLQNIRDVSSLNNIEDSEVGLGFNMPQIDEFTKIGQTYPPTKPIAELYPDKKFPQGQILDHPLESNAERKTSEKYKNLEKNWESKLQNVREGAAIHRQVRNYVQRVVKPGMRMKDICEILENKNRELIGLDPENPLSRGIGFPTGVSLNNVAAHYTPNSNDKTILTKNDIMKVDFGTQINGYIIDCAFTCTFDPKYDDFIKIVKEATDTGIREMGIDVRMADIGAAVKEVMCSECDIGDEMYLVKPIRNLNGHNIGQYSIHSGKTVPLVDNGDQTKMEEGELYAIETFGTTGNGIVRDSERLEVSHYMKNKDAHFVSLESKDSRNLLNFINKNFGNLAFCRRWIDRTGMTRYLLSLKKLVNESIIEPYPALEDKSGSFTAQYEHTIMLRPTCKEVVSRGFDF